MAIERSSWFYRLARGFFQIISYVSSLLVLLAHQWSFHLGASRQQGRPGGAATDRRTAQRSTNFDTMYLRRLAVSGSNMT